MIKHQSFSFSLNLNFGSTLACSFLVWNLYLWSISVRIWYEIILESMNVSIWGETNTEEVDPFSFH